MRKILVHIFVFVLVISLSSCSHSHIPTEGVYYCEQEGLFLDFYSFNENNCIFGNAWRNKNGTDEKLRFIIHRESEGLEVKTAQNQIVNELYGVLYFNGEQLIKYRNTGSSWHMRKVYERRYSPKDIAEFPQYVRTVFPASILPADCTQYNYYIDKNEVVLEVVLTDELFSMEKVRLNELNDLIYTSKSEWVYSNSFDLYSWNQNKWHFNPERGFLFWRMEPYIQFELYLAVTVEDNKNKITYVFLDNITDSGTHMDKALMPVKMQ